jgi:hypothetical protein
MDIHDRLSRQELLALLDVYAKNWLAHDGYWFLALEAAHGTEAAVEMDRRVWEQFAVTEARRIRRAFDIPADGGLDALETALRYRLYARINKQSIERMNARTLILRMIECRVQTTRQRKGLSAFACKPVGTAEFSQFAAAIDPRIRTRCLGCPPDPVIGAFCAWEFTLPDEDTSP